MGRAETVNVEDKQPGADPAARGSGRPKARPSGSGAARPDVGAVSDGLVNDGPVNGDAVLDAVPDTPEATAEANEPSGDAGANTSPPGNAPVSPHAELRAETMRIFHRMRKLPPGDPERERLRAEVIEDHMAYARRIAARYGGHGEVVEDFVQVAYLGLVKAVDNFDPDHGTGFLGYATPMIMGEIKRYFRDATWDVHVPRRMQELSSALRKATEALTQELGRSPSVAELAEKVKATPEEVIEAMDAASAYTTASLDRPVRVDAAEGASLAEFVGGEDPRFEAVVNREVLKPLLAKLGERDKRILMMRFFRGMTQSQIGEELHVSQMQVSRLLTRILEDLRAGFE
jgi:RNA polymerase sigma-B factor